MSLPIGVTLALTQAVNKLGEAMTIAASDDPKAANKVLNKIAEAATPIRKAENIAGGH